MEIGSKAKHERVSRERLAGELSLREGMSDLSLCSLIFPVVARSDDTPPRAVSDPGIAFEAHGVHGEVHGFWCVAGLSARFASCVVAVCHSLA